MSPQQVPVSRWARLWRPAGFGLQLIQLMILGAAPTELVPPIVTG